MLCTALSKKGFETPYRPTHNNHPCVLWVEASWDNFLWLSALAAELNREFCWRYSRATDHASIAVLRQIETMKYESLGLTEFAQAMPDRYKVPGDAVEAYRRFYLNEKSAFATWTRRAEPAWWTARAA